MRGAIWEAGSSRFRSASCSLISPTLWGERRSCTARMLASLASRNLCLACGERWRHGEHLHAGLVLGIEHPLLEEPLPD